MARSQARRVETTAGAKLILGTEPCNSLRVGRVVEGIALLQITGNPQTSQEHHECVHRVAAHLPYATACARPVAIRELRKLHIRLLQQQRGTGGRAASSDYFAFQEGRG